MVDDFSEYYADLLDGTYDCVDRIILNAYCPLGQRPGPFRYWWRLLCGSDDNLDKTHLMRLAGRFSRRVRAWAKAKQVPLIDCERGDRKHEMAEKYLPQDPGFVGVFVVFVSKAPALLWEVERYGKGGLNLKRPTRWPFVNHYSFHILDPDWGHLTIKMSGHPPFGAQVILNGHEWVERQAQRKNLEVVKEGNCFTRIADSRAFGEVADALFRDSETVGRLFEVCDRWIYSACLCFGLDLAEQERTGFRYQYSVYQLEYSRNLLFRRGRELDQVYQGVIDRTRSSLDLRTLKTIFGSKRRPFKGKTPAQLTVEKPTYNLTVVKVHFRKRTLKIYDKGERVLRVEAIVHNAKDLRCGRALQNLSCMVTALQEMTLRFLNVLRYAHLAFLDAGALDDLSQPTRRGERRVAGVDVNQARMRAVMEALMALAPSPDGFSVSDLALKVRERTGWSEQVYGTRQAAYDLGKIRGKDFVTKVAKSRRYLPTAEGFQTMSALLILREKVLKPVLAGVRKSRQGHRPKRPGTLDTHYESLQKEMRLTLAALGIAPGAAA